MTDRVRYLLNDLSQKIAFQHRRGKTPGVLFLPGFNSDMEGTKAQAIDSWCEARNIQITRFDYSGHGLSEGEFCDGSIGQWSRDAIRVLDETTQGPQVLVGSSMGGWIMLLVALARPDRVAGLLGIASAPDFTERLFRERLDDNQRASLAATGYCELANHYGEGKPHVIGQQLIEDGRDHLLLGSDIPLSVPVRLIHGKSDEDVPWELSAAIADRLVSEDVELQLVDGGDHRLSSPADIERMTDCLSELLLRAS